MEDFFTEVDFQQVGSSMLELITFLVVVIVVIAILDRWGPHKPPMPPSNTIKPESDLSDESRALKEDSSPLVLQGEDPLADSNNPLDSQQEEKSPPPSM